MTAKILRISALNPVSAMRTMLSTTTRCWRQHLIRVLIRCRLRFLSCNVVMCCVCAYPYPPHRVCLERVLTFLFSLILELSLCFRLDFGFTQLISFPVRVVCVCVLSSLFQFLIFAKAFVVAFILQKRQERFVAACGACWPKYRPASDLYGCYTRFL